MNFKTAFSDLEKNNYFIWDHFLSADEIVQAVAELKSIRTQNLFKVAGTGKSLLIDKSIRSDELYWIQDRTLTIIQKLIWDRLENLKNEINEHFYLGLWSFEGHYSYYPIDSFYQKHLDRFSSDDTRTISMVIYLNQNWVSGDGGELKIYSPHTKNVDHEVDPLAGRLICFLSKSVLHEVLLTHQPRLSIAGWWKRRN